MRVAAGVNETLERLYVNGVISVLDRTFAYFIDRQAATPSEELLLGAALVSHATENGDVCLDLTRHAGQPLVKSGEIQEELVRLPELSRWRSRLQGSGAVGGPGEFKPLVLDDQDRLYLYRYWHYEQALAEELQQRARRLFAVDEERLAAWLGRLFPPRPDNDTDWQKVAAAVAVLRGFSVISGLPGTGKTTTLARVLALLQEQAAPYGLRIRLAAPTGKAAARMQEAIRATKAQLAASLPPAILEAIPEQASTLHRLLGARPDSVYFHYNRDNPLPLDVLVIDEASMVDLPLMTKTVWALPPQARLILLGDKDQLSSVEAGAVLGDICARSGQYSTAFARRLARLTGQPIPATERPCGALQDAITVLRHSYRFGRHSGIGRLARAVNQGIDWAIQEVLQDHTLDDIRWSPPGLAATPEQLLLDRMATGYRVYFEAVNARRSPAEVCAAFGRYRVLCAQRHGPLGVENLNALFEATLRLLERRGTWYPGRPIMITCNDYNLKLFNGDIGIALPEAGDSPHLRVFFQAADGSLRRFPVTRLPAHETVFAMTIHKSQGSEFDQVLLVLPQEKSRLLTRELIYTGLTRARQRVELWGDLELVQNAANRPVSRSSGLRAKL